MKCLFIIVLVLFGSIICSDETNEFFANKLKAIINLIFDQTTYGAVNIPFFPDITLQKFRINDLKYTYTDNHNLKANIVIKGNFLGSPISNTFWIGMQFKVEDDKTIPISYQFQMVDPKKDMVYTLLNSQMNKMLQKLIGKEIPYNIFPTYIALEDKNDQNDNYHFNLDVASYMQQQKEIMDILDQNIQTEESDKVEQVEL